LSKSDKDGNKIYHLQKDKDYRLKVTILNFEPDESTKPDILEIETNNPKEVELAVEIESFYNLGLKEGGQSKPFNLMLENLQQSFIFPIKGKEKTPEPVKVFVNLYQGMMPVKIIKLSFTVE